MKFFHSSNKTLVVAQFVLLFGVLLAIPSFALAATMSVSPATGVYNVGNTFSVTVSMNTAGAAVNAADGTLSFNPKELAVVSVSRSSSIFNLWTAEPSFSNSAGTITFSGGSPSGFTGARGTIMTATFRTLTAGTPKLSMTSGSILAADGRGTNVLSSMSGGTYTVSAASTQPSPEVVIEYVAPANTPAAPKITSATHPDSAGWYTAKSASLKWTLPSGITGVRTLLDQNAGSVPTKVYDTPIDQLTLTDLADGESYFHLQFRNEDGWGKVAHYRLAVDSVRPEPVTLTLKEGADLASPKQTIVVTTGGVQHAPIAQYKVQLDGAEPFVITDISEDGSFVLESLTPGYHTLVVEVIDKAGNSGVGTFSFTTEAFAKPEFTDVPTELTAGVIPVIKGTTRPGSTVAVTFTQGSAAPVTYTSVSDETGVFAIIPDAAFTSGVYTLTAVATDQYGAQSDVSLPAKIAVQEPGLVRIGSYLVSVLSVFVPLIALVVISWLGGLLLWRRARTLRKQVIMEADEALAMLHKEFDTIESVLSGETNALKASRKTGKLTEAEESLINAVTAALRTGETRVEKELRDVSKVVAKQK
jgi:hypothetical protein